jgi:hypothetical protein
MFNRQRTLEMFGYDIDSNKRRRTNEEIANSGKENKKELSVVDNCPICGVERVIRYRASLKNRPCSKCFHNSPEMQAIKKAQKGKAVSEDTKQKMKDNHWSKHGGRAGLKGKNLTDEQKNNVSEAIKKWNHNRTPEDRSLSAKKAACTKRNIELDDFTYKTDELCRLRGTLEYKVFEQNVIERDIKCQYPSCSCNKRSKLVVHHLNGFNWDVDGRFDPDNGILLCKRHHKEFHDLFGRGDNTVEQYDNWLSDIKDRFDPNIKLIILDGVCGSGKSWVANQLGDLVSYVAFDAVPKEQHIYEIQRLYELYPNKPILYDPVRKATTIYKRYKQVWDVKYIVIDEVFDIIKDRITSRGGEPHEEKILKAINRIKSSTQIADFSGTSDEVLQYLISALSTA